MLAQKRLYRGQETAIEAIATKESVLIDLSQHCALLGSHVGDRARLAMQHHALPLETGGSLHDLFLLLSIVNKNGHVTMLGNSANLRQMPVFALELVAILELFLFFRMQHCDGRSRLCLP